MGGGGGGASVVRGRSASKPTISKQLAWGCCMRSSWCSQSADAAAPAACCALPACLHARVLARLPARPPARLQLYCDKMQSVNAFLHGSSIPRPLKRKIRTYYAGKQP